MRVRLICGSMAVLTGLSWMAVPASQAMGAADGPDMRGGGLGTLSQGIDWPSYLPGSDTGNDEALEHARRQMVEAGLATAGFDATASDDGECVQKGFYAETVGDLTGDRIEEGLEYRFEFDECTGEGSASSIAVEGADGSDLWTRTIPEFGVPFSVGDLDGKAGDDIIWFEIEETSTAATYLWKVTFEAVSGATGTSLWTRTYEDPWTGAGLAAVDGYLELDFAFPRGLTDDATGDRTADLLVARYNTLIANEGVAGTGHGASVAIMEVLSGRDGSPVASFLATGEQGYPDAAFVPDMTGDHLDDVAVLSFDRQDSGGIDGSLVAYPGNGGEAIWTSPVQSNGVPQVEGFELTGDERGDVLLRLVDHDSTGGNSPASSSSLQAVSGADGSNLWSSELALAVTVLPAGDVTGDKGTELLLIGRDAADGPDRAILLDGKGGGELWARSAGSFAYAGDSTKDGILDVVASDLVFSGGDETSVAAAVLSGANGVPSWKMTLPLGEATSLVPAFGDVDGNGTWDIAEVTSNGSIGTLYLMRAGEDGRPLWAESVQIEGRLLSLGGAHGSAQLDDLSEMVLPGSGTAFSQRRSGRDGSIIWTRQP